MDYNIDTIDSDGPSLSSYYFTANSDQSARRLAEKRVCEEVSRINSAGSLAHGQVLNVYKVIETLEEITN